jgi:hypothetical protein
MPNFNSIALHLALHGGCIGRSRRGLSGQAIKRAESKRDRKYRSLHSDNPMFVTPFLGITIISAKPA